MPLITEIEVKAKKKKSKYKKRWMYYKCDQKAFEESLKENTDGVSNFKDLSETLLKVAGAVCPRKCRKEGLLGNPWWNEECQKQVTKRARYRRTMQKNRTFENINNYKIQHRLTKKTIKNAKKEYWIKAAENDNILDAYKRAKIYKRTNLNTQLVNNKGELIQNESTAATVIAKYFSKVGEANRETKIREVYPRLQSKKELFNEKLNIEISKQEITNVMENLNLKKACGVDGINPFMIKFGGDANILLLFKLFNKVFSKSEFPEEWNRGEIIPIPKENTAKLEVSKFRPICLLSNVSKFFEKIMTERLKLVIEEENWLPNFQNGFRSNRSTVDNLVILQQEIHAAFKNKEYMLTVFLDIKKAYDCVNRQILINIIKKKGIKGKILEYLKFFLGERFNRVKYREGLSTFIEFKNGMPQGSPLSPLLFNLYLADITKIIDKNISQFADDLVIWETGKNVDRIACKLNQKLKRLNKYMKNINLTISPEKSVAVLFNRKRSNQECPELFIEGHTIKRENKAKYLGIIMDKRLNWSNHIKEIVSKANKRCRQLKSMVTKYNLHQSIAITLYKGLIRPILEYGSEIWGDTCKTNKMKLEAIEQRALTTALGVSKLAKRTEVNLEAEFYR